jgi:hypothetical protein
MGNSPERKRPTQVMLLVSRAQVRSQPCLASMLALFVLKAIPVLKEVTGRSLKSSSTVLAV